MAKCAFVKLLLHHLLVFLVTIFLVSCGKEKVIAPAVPPITTALTPLKAVYAPFEVVVFKYPKGMLGTQALDGLLNAQKVRVIPNDTLAIFVMPDVANGTSKLTLTANGKDYAMSVGVTALTNVLSADVYFNAIEAQINRNITAINAQADALLLSGVASAETQALKQNAQKLANQFSAYKTTYQGFSTAEKSDYARAMAANKSGDDELESLTATFSSQATALRGTQAVPNYESSIDECIHTFATEVARTIVLGAVESSVIVLLINPEPFTKVPLLLSLGVITVSFLTHLDLALAAAGTLFSRCIKAFQDLKVSQTTYGNGVDVPVDVTALYRSVEKNDEAAGTGSKVIDAALASYRSLKNTFNDLVGKLPTSLSLAPIANILKAQFSTNSRTIHNSYVRISNVSNPTVTLTLLSQADGNIRVRATTTATTTQNFTYDLTYVNPGFSAKGLTERISAQIIVLPPNPNCGGIPLQFDSIHAVLFPRGFYNGSVGRPFDLYLCAKGGVAPFRVTRSTAGAGTCASAQSIQYGPFPCSFFNVTNDNRTSTFICQGLSITWNYTITDASGASQSKSVTIAY